VIGLEVIEGGGFSIKGPFYVGHHALVVEYKLQAGIVGERSNWLLAGSP